MNKVQRSVHKLVDQMIQNISAEHAIDAETLAETVAPLMEVRTNTFVRCKGLVASKNNMPVCRCRVVPGTEFCRRHAEILLDEEETNGECAASTQQCAANTRRGGRCVRNAKPGNELCGLHMQQQLYEQRQGQNLSERVPCIHYKENTDHDDIDFCTGRTPHARTWFCKRHAHLQPVYERMYGAVSAHEYLRVKNKSVAIVDNFIKDNSDIFVQPPVGEEA
jgi:hypothetical protein